MIVKKYDIANISIFLQPGTAAEENKNFELARKFKLLSPDKGVVEKREALIFVLNILELFSEDGKTTH